MIFLVVAVVIALIALLLALISLRLLIGDWILGWLRGTAGLLLLACAAGLLFVAWNLRNYQQVSERPIATLAFSKVDDKQFAITLVDQNGTESRYQLSGDLWQLDVRLLKWADSMARIGAKPGYQIDRLSGRYIELTDEQKLPHSEIALRPNSAVFDVWSWLHSVNRYFSVLEAQSASATYLPMADGAFYSVSIGAAGVVATPMNERAKLAVEQWQ